MTLLPMLRCALACLALLAVVHARALASDDVPAVERDPFAFFRSAIELGESERERLARREVVSEILPAEGLQLGFFGAVAVDGDAEAMLDLLRQIRAFREGPRVLQTERFSNPPRLADLRALELPERDIEALRQCAPEDCDLKLTRAEILQIQEIVRHGRNGWRGELQQAFREIVLARTLRYVTDGHRGTPVLHSRSEPVDQAQRVSDLIREMPPLAAELPDLAAYFERYPDAPLPAGAESFLYWTVEDLRHPVVIVRHMVILPMQGGQNRPVVIAASKQVLATHYLDASIGLTCLLSGEPGTSRNYFVYLNRSALDFLDGFPAWLRRRIVSGGVRREAVTLLLGIREKIERRARELNADAAP